VVILNCGGRNWSLGLLKGLEFVDQGAREKKPDGMEVRRLYGNFLRILGLWME